ncbi:MULTISPECIES: hypothetical protein [Halorussus]|uniref:hypothetical protein n=1 Tax=Halorussus TaxID=1070314 RepID=UPI00209F456D|nr:hypothetical protein [Halorussus vallis]USZ77497.1 hypothetical protein NGM07_09215 [Halorussus vallis]
MTTVGESGEDGNPDGTAAADDSSDALGRVRRAKARQRRGRRLDGGAVAAGTVVVLGFQTLPAFLLMAGLPENAVATTAAATALSVPLGAFGAGWLGGAGGRGRRHRRCDSASSRNDWGDAGRRGARHGVATVALSTLLGVSAGLLLATGRVAALLAGPALTTFALPAGLLAAVVGAVAGYLGGHRRGRAG